MRRASPRVRRLAVIAAVLIGLMAPAATVAAAASCTFNLASRVVDIQLTGFAVATVYVDGSDRIAVNNTTSDFNCFDGGTAATRTTTDLIRITGDGSFQFTMLDMIGGRFEPGFTSEASGTPEIEFQIDLGGATTDRLRIVGSNSADDFIRFGSDGINLNNDDDVDTVNASATAALPAGVENWDAFTGQGNDDVLANGSGVGGSSQFTSALEIQGDTGADDLTGGSGNDTIGGGLGDDTLLGEGGHDTFQITGTTPDGADVITGGAGLDQLSYGGRTVGVIVDEDGVADDGDPSANGGAGENDNVTQVETLIGGIGADQFTGGSENNDLIGSPGGDTLLGGGGNDWLFGQDGADTLDGGANDDSLLGGTESDIMNGGPDTDQARYVSATSDLSVTLDGNANDGVVTPPEADDVGADVENVMGGSGNDFLQGDGDANTLEGEGGDDTLEGLAGADTLRGDWIGVTGNDTLEGGPGADQLNGWTGIDTADYSASAAAVTVNLNTPSASGGDAAGDTICRDQDISPGCVSFGDVSIENVIGSDDTVTGDSLTGSAVANVLTGRAGPDTLGGLGADDTLVGGPAGDTLDGGDTGETNGDTLDYSTSPSGVQVNLEGSSALGGDAQGDTLIAGSNENIIGSDATSPHEFLIGDSQNNRISGGNGNESIHGQGGNDIVSGDAGQDTLGQGDATDGADVLNGGSGLDTLLYSVRSKDVHVSLDASPNDGEDADGTGGAEEGDNVGADIENIQTGSGDDVVVGDDDAENFYTDAGDDTVQGGGGNDWFEAAGGADDLDGDAGNDSFPSSPGDDTLDGGAGQDNFVQEATADGGDAITGGSEVDSVHYSARTSSVSVTADGVANDGQRSPAEGDNVAADVEEISTGSGNDLIAGAPTVPNTVFPGDGIDTISYVLGGPVTASLDTNQASVGLVVDTIHTENLTGSSGADSLTGGAEANAISGGDGVDQINGLGGNDGLNGGTGNDNMKGAAGNDSLTGAKGKDVMNGGSGKDFLAAKDRKMDRVLGGTGRDRARVDAGLDVVRGVEQVA